MTDKPGWLDKMTVQSVWEACALALFVAAIGMLFYVAYLNGGVGG
jgi:hypothetical protein